MQIEKHKLKQGRKLLLRLLLLPLRRGLKQLRMHHLLRMFKPMIDHKQLGLVILLVVAKVQLDLIAHHHHHHQLNENHPVLNHLLLNDDLQTLVINIPKTRKGSQLHHLHQLNLEKHKLQLNNKLNRR
jgi:hypothetical protein